jgi:hypothetical protein
VRRFLAITERIKAKRRLAKLDADLKLAQEPSQDDSPENDNDFDNEDQENCGSTLKR